MRYTTVCYIVCWSEGYGCPTNRGNTIYTDEYQASLVARHLNENWPSYHHWVEEVECHAAT